MKRWQKVVISIVILIIVVVVLYFSGILKVNLSRRSVYAGCSAGCNTDVNNVSDCAGFLDYLKKSDPGFVSDANTMHINLDKPDKVTKTVSTDGHIRCWYWMNY